MARLLEYVAALHHDIGRGRLNISGINGKPLGMQRHPFDQCRPARRIPFHGIHQLALRQELGLLAKERVKAQRCKVVVAR